MRGIIALTGATGFIGSAIARRLVTAGWRVRALIRPSSARAHPAGISVGTLVQWVEGTLDDCGVLERLVQRAETVIHSAGAVRAFTKAEFYQVNTDAVARLARIAAKQEPPPRFLLLSSLAAREPAISPYADSKRQGEIVLARVADRMRWTALRPPAVYGLGDYALLPLFRMMWRGVAPMAGRKGARFSMLYVDDLAEAVARWLVSEGTESRIFELDDGQPGGYSWSEVVDTVERLRGKRLVRFQIPGPVLSLAATLNTMAASARGRAPLLSLWKVREIRHPDWVCDNSAFCRATKWSPTVRLEEGLRRTVGLKSFPPTGSCSPM